MKPLFFTVYLCFVLVGFSQNKFQVNDLDLSWRIVENNYQGKNQTLSQLVIFNRGKASIPTKGWKMYFNFVRKVSPLSKDALVDLKHVNGDLYELYPNSNFKEIKVNESFTVDFVSGSWLVNYTDAPCGFFIYWEGDQTYSNLPALKLIPSTEPKQYLRFPSDKIGLITPKDIYKSNQAIEDISADNLCKVFPTPVEYQRLKGEFRLTSGTQIINSSKFQKEVDYFQNKLSQLLLPKGEKGNGTIQFLSKVMDEHVYELEINSEVIKIYSNSSTGFFYAVQSLLSAVDPEFYSKKNASISIANMKIKDYPRFAYRAFFLDVSRNFQSKEEILKVLDLMALYKLNILHLHLNDDEGWRIEIPSLPELTAIGSRRGMGKNMLPPSYGSGYDVNNKAGTGYYSKADYIEILKYATDRHIEIIPEIETPGHARAAVKSMEARYYNYLEKGNKVEAEKYLLSDLADKSVYSSVQLWNDNVMNPALPSVYTFIEKVVDELILMHKEAGAPLKTIHMGGDEVPNGAWEKSPLVDTLIANGSVRSVGDLWYYFFGRLNTILKERGLFLSGWEEAGIRFTTLDNQKTMIPNPDFVNQHFQLDVWNNVLGWGAEDLAYKLANSGYKVVLSCVSNNYLDMAYYKAFEEPGYYWGSYTDVNKPFEFIPYDYFKNAKEDRTGAPLDRSVFEGKQRLTDYGKGNIVGIKGLLWSENNISADHMEYMLLPKLLGIAERAWSQDPLWATENNEVKAEEIYNKAWSTFANIVGKRELPRLDYYAGGYNYRIPSPGLQEKDGKVWANIQLPGLIIRYSENGKEPNMKSKIYTKPIDFKKGLKFQIFSTNGRKGRVSEL